MVDLKNYSFEDSSSKRRRRTWWELSPHGYWMKLALLIVMMLSVFKSARAQFIGYNAAQSTTQNLFTNQAANGTSPTIKNLGQSSHFVTICNFNFAGTVVLESSQNGSFAPPNTVAAANYGLAEPGNLDGNCHLIQAGGYYPTLRVRVTNYVSGSTSVFYSGIGGPINFAPPALSTIGPNSPIGCDVPGFNGGVPTGTANGVILVPQIAAQVIIVCSVTLSFSANTTAGQITFGSGSPQAPGTPGSPCAGIIRTVFAVALTAQSPDPQHFLGGAGGLFRLRPGETLCVSTGAISASTVIDFSFAQITF